MIIAFLSLLVGFLIGRNVGYHRAMRSVITSILTLQGFVYKGTTYRMSSGSTQPRVDTEVHEDYERTDE